jgi:hypothetical protein
MSLLAARNLHHEALWPVKDKPISRDVATDISSEQPLNTVSPPVYRAIPNEYTLNGSLRLHIS